MVNIIGKVHVENVGAVDHFMNMSKMLVYPKLSMIISDFEREEGLMFKRKQNESLFRKRI